MVEDVDSIEPKRVVILFGGANSDNYRSCQQFNDVFSALQSRKFDVGAIGLTLEGSWVLFDNEKAVVDAVAEHPFELSNESASKIEGASLTRFPTSKPNLLRRSFLIDIGSARRRWQDCRTS